ncbi:hypothetical protein KVO79_25900, partial [Serratia quinivorans]|uniref:hypothetical protein n=1 Tax=Serratia quinivorans TaxID=137545 RepID=UPI001C44530D
PSYFFYPSNKHHIISKIYPTPLKRSFPDKNPVSPSALHLFYSSRSLATIHPDKHIIKTPSLVLSPDNPPS